MTSPSRAVRRAGQRHVHLSGVLTKLREDSGLTFGELAARTTVSASALKRAADLHTPVAPEHVVTAFARACGADADQEREVLKLWRAARAEQRGILATLHAPAVAAIRTGADLTAALAAAYERAGAPALRVLQERATTDGTDGALLLPRTSAWRITRREARPTTWTQCAAFLRGCGIHPRRMPDWHDAWTRTRTPTPAGRRPPAADLLLVTERTHLATSTSSKRIHLALPTSTATDAHWIAPLSRTLRAGLPGEQQALTRFFDGLTPAERHTVLAAGLTRLLTTRARRNGAAPDTGLDVIAVNDDGTLHLIQAKHSGDTTPPAPPARAPQAA
ncbi:helix-turn-helix domain-containing protein [Streptomyces sp. NPDC001073]